LKSEGFRQSGEKFRHKGEEKRVRVEEKRTISTGLEIIHKVAA